MVRSIRRDSIEKFKAMKKANEITEDDLKTCEKDVQTLTDRFVKDIETLLVDKEKEIMTI